MIPIGKAINWSFGLVQVMIIICTYTKLMSNTCELHILINTCMSMCRAQSCTYTVQIKFYHGISGAEVHNE